MPPGESPPAPQVEEKGGGVSPPAPSERDQSRAPPRSRPGVQGVACVPAERDEAFLVALAQHRTS